VLQALGQIAHYAALIGGDPGHLVLVPAVVDLAGIGEDPHQSKAWQRVDLTRQIQRVVGHHAAALQADVHLNEHREAHAVLGEGHGQR
jgi:hypothetical protein